MKQRLFVRRALTVRMALTVVVTLSSMTAFAHAAISTIAPSVAAAVASPLGPDADVQADADRKPAELLTFVDIRPGDKVADLIPGDGYFTGTEIRGHTDKFVLKFRKPK